MSAYSASKAAVRNLARTWAEDLKGTGIRVNVLSPGATATELAKAALGEAGQKIYAAMTPLQRMADPSEIAAAAAFLASSDSSFMTASELAVDGGLGATLTPPPLTPQTGGERPALRDHRLRQDRAGAGQGVRAQAASPSPWPPHATRRASRPPPAAIGSGVIVAATLGGRRDSRTSSSWPCDSNRTRGGGEGAARPGSGKTLVDVANAYGVPRLRNWAGSLRHSAVAQAFGGSDDW